MKMNGEKYNKSIDFYSLIHNAEMQVSMIPTLEYREYKKSEISFGLKLFS